MWKNRLNEVRENDEFCEKIMEIRLDGMCAWLTPPIFRNCQSIQLKQLILVRLIENSRIFSLFVPLLALSKPKLHLHAIAKSFTGWMLLSSKSNSQSNRNGLLNSSIAHRRKISAKSEGV